MEKDYPIIILTVLSVFFAFMLNAQNSDNCLLLKNKISKQIITIAPVSKFKAKTLGQEKIKGRIIKISDSFFITEMNDTIHFDNIRWIKAKKPLKKWEQTAGVAGLFIGALYTPVSILASSMNSMMGNADPVIFLLPAIPIGIGVLSIRALGGRRYKMKRWQLYSVLSTNNAQNQFILKSGISFRKI